MSQLKTLESTVHDGFASTEYRSEVEIA
jgi:hypothetical protein